MAKAPTSALVTPFITESVIDGDVLTEWESCLVTLPEWNERFPFAASASDDIPESTAAIKFQETFVRTKALNFKAPAAKRKQGAADYASPPPVLDISLYSPFFKETEVIPIMDIDHILGVLARLDKIIFINNEALSHFMG